MELFIVGLIAATLRVATPLIFGTLGELFSERAGILNLGIEGTMFFGAFVGLPLQNYRVLCGWGCWERSLAV
jgi:general nucleoside transport system permease protein